jgi:hypothetical protein
MGQRHAGQSRGVVPHGEAAAKEWTSLDSYGSESRELEVEWLSRWVVERVRAGVYLLRTCAGRTVEIRKGCCGKKWKEAMAAMWPAGDRLEMYRVKTENGLGVTRWGGRWIDRDSEDGQYGRRRERTDVSKYGTWEGCASWYMSWVSI